MKIHFIGIGGIGVSALAKYYLESGWQVSGSDLVSSEITRTLKKTGVRIFIGKHKAANLPKYCDLVVYSPAVQKTNPELKKAYKILNTKYNIQILSYPEALGELTRKYFTIAVCGTHGKSTTSSMLGLLMVRAGLDPTVIIGTKLKEFGDSTHSINSGLTLSCAEGSNCRVGKSGYLVIEADEHFASFLNYWPQIIVLTRLEADHLDYFKNFRNYSAAFKEFISHLPEDGVLVANRDDRNIKQLTINNKPKTTFYSLRQPEAGKLRKILKVPGEHNVSDALAALAVARILKILDKISFKALSAYKGAWRRFEEKEYYIPNTKYKILVISDYGHHPTEIKATLAAARQKYPKSKIWLVYQPHQYQRTFYLFKDFVRAFKTAPVNEIIITDIYDVAGREEKRIKEKVSSVKLIKAINKPNAIYLPKDEILGYLKKNLRSREVLIIMGAGDIYDLTKNLQSVIVRTY